MAINTKDLEVPFYLVLEDDDLQKGLDEVTSKIKKSGKIVENEFIKKFSDAEDKFQTLVKLGDKLYSVVGRLNKKGAMDARTKPEFTQLQNLSEAKTLLYSKKLSQYNDNKEKLAIARIEKERKQAEKEQAKELKKAQAKALKQRFFDDSMKNYIGVLSSRGYSSSKEFKDIGKQIASAISKATTAGLDTSQGTVASKMYDSEYARMSGNVSKIGSIFKGILSPMQIAKLELDEVRAKMRDLQEEIMFLGEGSRVDVLKKELKDLSKDAEKLEKKTKKGLFQSLFDRLKSYGLLRVVRNLFMSIEKGFSSGINNLVQFDKQANGTMSSISSSFEKLNASIAVIAMPLIEIIEPILSSISNSIVAFANNISMASAQMKGLGEYTKISEEYMKDLQSEANSTLLAFDKFESLNGATSPFEKATIGEEDKQRAEDYGNTIKRLQDIFLKLWEFIKEIGKAVAHIFKELEPYLDDIIDGILFLVGVLADVVVVIGKVFAWITKIIDTKGDLMALLMIITAIASTIAYLTGHYIKGTAIAISGIAAVGFVGASQYANGGMVDSGSLFVAGEAGAELVTTMPSGQTGVTNIAQFKQAMVEAIYECSDVFQQGDGSVVLNLDGAQIARSKSFKNELNRTNSGLNLR